MNKLILAALGYAAWRWLNSAAERTDAPAQQKALPAPDTDRRSAAAEDPREAKPDTTPEKQGDAGSITYRVVEHDGGWAYKVGDVFSETFPSHDAALEAARTAAREHQMEGEPEPIEYQDEDGQWRQEDSDGRDRPATAVEDAPATTRLAS